MTSHQSNKTDRADGSRVFEPLEVAGPVFPPRGAVGARAREERVALKRVRLSREDVDRLRLLYVLVGGRWFHSEGGHVAFVLLCYGGGAAARSGHGGEVILEH